MTLTAREAPSVSGAEARLVARCRIGRCTSGQLMDLLAIAVCTLAPIAFWFVWIQRRDREHPEPAHLLLRCYLLGGLSTLLVLGARPVLEEWFADAHGRLSAARDAFLLTAPLEEVAKAFALLVAVRRHAHFDQFLDGMVYGAMVALGFATVENVVYVVHSGEPQLAVMRGFTATLMHVATTGLVGLGLALAWLRDAAPRVPTVVSLVPCLIAVALHGVYDYGLALSDDRARLTIVTVLPITFVALGVTLRRLQTASARSIDPATR
jgi:RsiW-degrading membrane proteinase PrsW (M82 family)